MKHNIKNLTLLLLAMVLLGGCSSANKTTTITGANKVAGGATESTARSSAITPAAQEVNNAATAQQAEVTRSENFTLAEGEDASISALTKPYHVVVGSFRNRSNAKGLQSTLNAEGNNAIIVLNENGMYRVIISSFDTYKESRSCITNISGRFPDAWVLVKKQ